MREMNPLDLLASVGAVAGSVVMIAVAVLVVGAVIVGLRPSKSREVFRGDHS